MHFGKCFYLIKNLIFEYFRIRRNIILSAESLIYMSLPCEREGDRLRWWDSDKNAFYISFCTLWRTESLRHSLKLVPPPFHKGGSACAKLWDNFSTFPFAEFSQVVEGADPYRLCHDTIPQPRRRLYLLKSCRAVPWCRRYKQDEFNKPAGASPRPTTWVCAKLLSFIWISL